MTISDKLDPVVGDRVLASSVGGRGAMLKLTLEIDGSAPDGYAADVVDVVSANIRYLKLRC